jgi:RNA polymerase sigma factor (sigma-70 family)
MSTVPLQAAVRHLHQLVRADGADGLSDAELLQRFVAGRDEAAFELLVWRHGPMVLGVCRRVLRRDQDAEDAFQATFLVLVRKAGSIGNGAAVGSWLHKVAYRVALGARARADQRGRREKPLVDVPAAETDGTWRDLAPVLDEEVSRLPYKYRVPLVLCYLEGKTLDEAARQLGCPRGTVGSRLARGRERLRLRLARRGLGFACGALAAVLPRTATGAAVPAPLVRTTVRIAVGFAHAPGVISPNVVVLTEGVLRAMSMNKVNTLVGLVLVIAALATGAGGLSYRMYAAEKGEGPSLTALGAPAPQDDQPKADKPAERLTYRGWGTATDPDGDCKFTFQKGKLTITVPGKDHDLGVERQRMNAPRILQELEGDFIVQVKVTGTFKPVDADTNERAAFQGAGLLVLEDDNNYLRLERACYTRDGEDHHYTIWELRRNGDIERFGQPDDHALEDGKDTWLRIERHGDKLCGAVSQDEEKWTYLDLRMVAFPKKLQVGTAAVNTSKQEFTPQFSEFKLFREAGT